MGDMKVLLPQPTDLNKGFSDLYGRTFRCFKTLKPWLPTAKDAVAAAFYGPQDEGAAPMGVWLMDLPCAAGMAAALSMLPAPMAKSSAASGKLTEALAENYGEVMNVAASMWEVTDGRAVLQRVLLPPASLPADLLALIPKSRTKLDLTTELQGYEAGRMMLVVL